MTSNHQTPTHIHIQTHTRTHTHTHTHLLLQKNIFKWEQFCVIVFSITNNKNIEKYLYTVFINKVMVLQRHCLQFPLIAKLCYRYT